MKSLLTFFSIVLLTIQSLSGQIPCSSFCVKDITMDTMTKNSLLVHVEFSSDTVVFINYPHVSAITDSDGDTVATGTLSFFVQFRNTIQEYPAEASWISVPEGFTGNVHFNFDQSSCILPFPCQLTHLEDENQLTGVTVFPNPASASWFIKSEEPFENLSIEITDINGKVVQSKAGIHGSFAMMDRDDLPAGIYAIRLRDRGLTTVEKIILQ